ncbi:MAG TPA: FAD-dependent oxidoreductase, partial [Polyangiaceae bacterium]|nr:FAD-dependent oxidoreductase [Polyangiaceae bacterium]
MRITVLRRIPRRRCGYHCMGGREDRKRCHLRAAAERLLATIVGNTGASRLFHWRGYESGVTRPRIVIVGGGFGGLNAARALAGSDTRVTLVDRRNHHLFQPL